MGLLNWLASKVVEVDYLPPPDDVDVDSNGERLHTKRSRWFPGLHGGDDASGAGVRRRPRPSTDDEGELVTCEVYEDDEVIEVDASVPSSHFERYRRLIDSFDEDRENWFEKVVRWLFLLLAYVLPVMVAYAMGKEIGDAYGGVFSWSDGWSLGTHTVAMAGEFSLAMMTLSAATALRRMTQDASYAPKFFGSLVSFLLFSLASGLAQWFISSYHIAPRDTSGLVALVFRVAMVPAVDIASLLFLAVMSFKSLKKFVSDQRVRAQAIRDINEAELEIERAQSSAARRQTEERQDLKMKEQRNAVWLELDRLHAQSMIAHAKQQALLSGPTTVTPDIAAPNEVKIRRIERGS